jgi:hypothetical protein
MRTFNRRIDNKKLKVYYIEHRDARGEPFMIYVNNYISKFEHDIIDIQHLIVNNHLCCVITYIES